MEQLIDFEAYSENQGTALSAKYPVKLANCRCYLIRRVCR